MTLHVYTARVGYAGADALDITRRRADADARSGMSFLASSIAEAFAAPRWLLNAAKGYSSALPPGVDPMPREAFARWRWYERHYLAAMTRSRDVHRGVWEATLRRDVVTGLCFCGNVAACHRALWAGVLVTMGAAYKGER